MVAGGGIEHEPFVVLPVPKLFDLATDQASTLVTQLEQGYQSDFRVTRIISSVGTHSVASCPPLAFQLDFTGASTGGQRVSVF